MVRDGLPVMLPWAEAEQKFYRPPAGGQVKGQVADVGQDHDVAISAIARDVREGIVDRNVVIVRYRL